MRHRKVCIYLVTLLLVWAAPANGTALRLLVRDGHDDGAQLAQRIEGQASDLAVDITVVATAELESGVDEQLRTADRLATEHDAEAIVWLERTTGSGWRLYILHPGRSRVLVRDMGEGTDQTHAGSAILEEAALVVRATLQALEAGEEIGVERSLVERPAAPPRRSSPSRGADRAQVASHPAPPPTRADRVFAVNAGWQIALDGVSPLGQQGPILGTSFSRGPWQVRLTLAASLGAELESGPATLRLARHAAVGEVAVRTAPSRWVLAAGVQMGAALFARSTIRTTSGFAPSADRIYASLLVGPELCLSFHPQWPRHGWIVGFAAGADYVPRAPQLGTGTSREFQPLNALWLVEPRSTLYMGLDF